MVLREFSRVDTPEKGGNPHKLWMWRDGYRHDELKAGRVMKETPQPLSPLTH